MTRPLAVLLSVAAFLPVVANEFAPRSKEKNDFWDPTGHQDTAVVRASGGIAVFESAGSRVASAPRSDLDISWTCAVGDGLMKWFNTFPPTGFLLLFR